MNNTVGEEGSDGILHAFNAIVQRGLHEKTDFRVRVAIGARGSLKSGSGAE